MYNFIMGCYVNLRVSFMYLNTARFMIKFISSVKSAFPFTNKSKVTEGIKFKVSESRFLCSVYNLQSKVQCSASPKIAPQLHIGFDTILTRNKSAFRLLQLYLIRNRRIEETLSPSDG